MNKVSGKIMLKESGVGIPDLLVILFNIDPKTQPEEIIASITGTDSTPIATAGQGFPLAQRWRNVLLKRSTCAVSPVSLPTGRWRLDGSTLA